MTDEPSREVRKVYERTRHSRGESIFDIRETSRHEIADAVFSVLLETELPPRSQAILGAVFRALYGREPYHRLDVVRARPGSKIKFASAIERAHESVSMCDEIDMAVASGAKLEAEVARAMAKYRLSRREVFRRLKEVHQQRLSWTETLDGKQNPAFSLYVPEGYDIDQEGKLVEGRTLGP